MGYLSRKRFDWIYFIIIPAVVLTFFVPIRMRVGNIVVLPFVVMWLIFAMLKARVIQSVLTRKFLSFFVPLSIFFVMRSIVAGWHEYGGIPLLRLLQYTGLVLFYIYLFHYTITRHKYKELLILNAIILLCLGYGCFSSMSFDLGRARRGIEEMQHATMGQTIDRLEYAAAGGTNFGDAYSMVFISIALFVYLMRQPLRWKVLYSFVIGIFILGIYRASFSTGLAIFIFMMGIAFFDFGRSRSLRYIKIILPIISILFIFVVSRPQILSPLSEIVKDLGVAIEPMSNDYSLRLISISDAMAGDKDTYAVERAELYWNSLKIFVHNPIFGYRWEQIFFGTKHKFGAMGHSYFFDAIAMGGMTIGVFLFIAVANFFKYLRYVYKVSGLSHELLRGVYYSFWALVIVASINQVDSFTIFISFFFVIPAIPFFNYENNLRQNSMCYYPGVRYI